MSHNTTHRRNFPVPNPEQTPIDPSITTISNHFSRLYFNHKARSSLTQPIFDSSTTASLTKSQSQRTRNRGKPHYYYTNKPVQEHSQTLDDDDDDQEPEDNIKEPLLLEVKGYVDLMSKDEEKSDDVDEVKKVTMVSADMPPYMQIHVVDVTRKTYDSLVKFATKTLALTLKKDMVMDVNVAQKVSIVNVYYLPANDTDDDIIWTTFMKVLCEALVFVQRGYARKEVVMDA
ncbi:hypothetical protein L6452_34257 [Arctium lappa]|uniref:Uncharacterized protein n=1 Tax=Arctium lappa TaxID=4217 RepID=A0ACB8YHU5_ARCLA|nr:hypothetical protein L6452_34257 [Arctium lappa]